MIETDSPDNEVELSGFGIIHDPYLNKGSAFSENERNQLGLRGLLPPHVLTIKEQAQRAMQNLRNKPNDLDRYIFLMGLQERNRTLFYRVMIDNMEELMPIVYTPTVGKACQKYGQIFRRPQGLFITLRDKGHVKDVLNNWPDKDIRVIVVTDGERILGLGDLGANGMGIPVGKLALYSACAGIKPRTCLPITIDVGTNNTTSLEDPLYIGLHQQRERGAAYDDLIEEFVQSVQEIYPKAIIQFEDFGTHNAFMLLSRYRDQCTTFNDDIQGTAAVALAGVYSALRITKQPITEQTILFLGAGEAGVGIGHLIASAISEEGLSIEEAQSHCWFVDSKGLVVSSRENLAEHKLPFAHDYPFEKDLATVIHSLKPTMLIGASGVPAVFTQEVIEAMAQYNEHPVIFALSNPTSHSECTAEQAYYWSKGRAIYASGSPFPPVIYNGQTFVSGQSNNAYVFPGIGLGAVISETSRITNSMFMAVARTLATLATEDDLNQGRLFPALSQIREISAHIAVSVIQQAQKEGLTTRTLPDDLLAYVKDHMYDPNY